MTEPEPYQYHLLYQLEPKPEGVTKDEVPKGYGAADAAFILSCLYPPDGSFSLLVLSLDGRTSEPLDDMQLFKVWTMLAKRIADSETLSPTRKAFGDLVFKQVCAAIKTRKEAL